LVRINIPLNFVTAPLAADLFLLAILAIGRKEVHDGTIGADNISPIDIMAFFLTLAYIAISIDASGLIRWLAFKVLQKGGGVGHRLFFYLYAFFFGLGSFIGNDPIILSGTAFLAYMTRVSSNIVHPRAWIHSQFAVANIASAVLVSSNPTNLVLAGAFEIKFIVYTANMIVPVVATAIVIFPFLLYIIFADESLIPYSIQMHELSEEAKARPPVNPNIPHARGNAEEEEEINNENGKLLSLEEIMNPFLDKGGAAFGAVIMAATLITLLAINAASQSGQEHPVFWVTLPAAFIMFCWDLASGWLHRHETREIAARGRRAVEAARAERDRQGSSRNLQEQNDDASDRSTGSDVLEPSSQSSSRSSEESDRVCHGDPETTSRTRAPHDVSEKRLSEPEYSRAEPFPKMLEPVGVMDNSQKLTLSTSPEPLEVTPTFAVDEEKRDSVYQKEMSSPQTLVSLTKDLHRWLQETFPTVTVVVSHMPFPLVPFALAMFVLVQALVTKGWVPVFAYGWDHWVNKTGTVGAIGGMGFLSVILCNVSIATMVDILMDEL
jgi:Na+/H+ antiporter NhaD/arsenite permease-like protein